MNIFGKRSDLPFFTQEHITRGFVQAWAGYYLQPNTVGRHCAWADHYLQAVIRRSRGGLSANEKEEKFASNDNVSYASLCAMELEKLLANDTMTALCQTKMSSTVTDQTSQTTKMKFEKLLGKKVFKTYTYLHLLWMFWAFIFVSLVVVPTIWIFKISWYSSFKCDRCQLRYVTLNARFVHGSCAVSCPNPEASCRT